MPGITWPPVPPPTIRNVEPAISAGVLADVHEHAERRQRAHQGTASGADHRKRDALGRRHAEHHAHVHHGLHDDAGADAEGEIGAEFIRDEHGRAQPAPEDDDKSKQKPARAQQTELFADHGVNEIRVGLGQVEQLLAALHESLAEHAARADGDLRLLRLVAGVARGERFLEVGLQALMRIELLDDAVVRIEIADDARHAVGLLHDEEHYAEHGDRGGHRAVGPLQPGHQKHDRGSAGEDNRRAEIGHDDGQNHQAHGHGDGHQRIPGVDGARSPGHEVSQEQHQRGLGDFGRLETDGADAQPAVMRAIDEVHDAKQDQRDPHRGEGHRRMLQLAVTGVFQQHHDTNAHSRGRDLLDEEMPGGTIPELGHDGGSAVNEEQPYRGHGHHGGEQDAVGSELRHASLLGPKAAGDLFERSATMLVTAELVETGAGGRQQYGVAGAAMLVAVLHGGFKGPGAHDGDGALDLAGDLPGCGADQQRGPRFFGERPTEDRVVAALVLAAEDDPEAAGKGVQRLEGGVHVGGFGIVVEVDAAHAADKLQAVLHGTEGADGAGNGGSLRASEARGGGGGHSVLHVVAAAYGDLGDGNKWLAVVPHRIVFEPQAALHAARAAKPNGGGGGEAYVIDADRIFGVEHGEVARALGFKQPAFGGGVVLETAVAVQVVGSDVQSHGDAD